jgi:hypothetical protein
MRRTALTALPAAATLAATAAAVAIAAPVVSRAPTIRGRPAYQQTLTCDKGMWSSDAVSFSYAWAVSGGSTFAGGQTLKVPQSVVGYDVVCIVTGRDAQGQATPASSGQVLIAPGVSRVKIVRASATNGVVTISGFVGPAAARRKSPNGWSTVTLDRELSSKTDVQQIAGPRIVRTHNGAFTISGHDAKGTHTYVIGFEPSQGSDYAPGSATRTLTVP